MTRIKDTTGRMTRIGKCILTTFTPFQLEIKLRKLGESGTRKIKYKTLILLINQILILKTTKIIQEREIMMHSVLNKDKTNSNNSNHNHHTSRETN